MDINPDHEASYTTHYQEVFLEYVENEYCAKHRRLLVNKPEIVASNNPFSTTASASGQSSFHPYDLSSNDDESLMPKNVAEMTPGCSDHTARWFTAARLYLNSPPEGPMNWGQNDLNRNDYHSDPIEISITFWLPDITNWWYQQGETNSKYANLFNVAHDIFSILPHGLGVEARFSVGRDVIWWRQSKPTGETLCKKVIVRQYVWANNGILAGHHPVLDSTEAENDRELKKEAEERKLHRMAKVHDFWEMWQGSQNLRAIQKESHT